MSPIDLIPTMSTHFPSAPSLYVWDTYVDMESQPKERLLEKIRDAVDRTQIFENAFERTVTCSRLQRNRLFLFVYAGSRISVWLNFFTYHGKIRVEIQRMDGSVIHFSNWKRDFLRALDGLPNETLILDEGPIEYKEEELVEIHGMFENIRQAQDGNFLDVVQMYASNKLIAAHMIQSDVIQRLLPFLGSDDPEIVRSTLHCYRTFQKHGYRIPLAVLQDHIQPLCDNLTFEWHETARLAHLITE